MLDHLSSYAYAENSDNKLHGNNQKSPQQIRDMAINDATASFRFSFGKVKELSKDQKPKQEVKMSKNKAFKDLNSYSSGRYDIGVTIIILKFLN